MKRIVLFTAALITYANLFSQECPLLEEKTDLGWIKVGEEVPFYFKALFRKDKEPEIKTFTLSHAKQKGSGYLKYFVFVDTFQNISLQYEADSTVRLYLLRNEEIYKKQFTKDYYPVFFDNLSTRLTNIFGQPEVNNQFEDDTESKTKSMRSKWVCGNRRISAGLILEKEEMTTYVAVRERKEETEEIAVDSEYVYQPDWIIAGFGSDKSKWYVYKQPVKNQYSNQIKIWCKAITPKGTFNKKVYLNYEAKMLYLFDCSNSRYQSISTVYYDSKGGVIDSNEHSYPSWSDVIPDTVLQLVFDKACSLFNK